MTNQTKIILAFITIFAIGFASGYLFDRSVSAPVFKEYTERSDRPQHRWSENMEQREERMRNRLSEQLELTDDQQDPFFSRVQQYRQEIHSSIRNLRSQEQDVVRDHYDTFRTEISGLLNSNQLEKLDSYLHPDSVRQRRTRGRPGGH